MENSIFAPKTEQTPVNLCEDGGVTKVFLRANESGELVAPDADVEGKN